MQQIRIRRPGIRRERPWHENLPPDPRDPDVVRAKALARAGDRARQKNSQAVTSPRARRDGGRTVPAPARSPSEGPTSMHPRLMQEITPPARAEPAPGSTAIRPSWARGTAR